MEVFLESRIKILHHKGGLQRVTNIHKLCSELIRRRKRIYPEGQFTLKKKPVYIFIYN